jgi:phosphoesterase RecJ-like protein
MTDTGSFRYSAVVPGLHRIVADILERGNLTPAPIHTAVYDTRSLQSLRLLSSTLATISLRHDGQIGYMFITSQMLRDLGADSEEAEGFVNYVLSIDGVKAGLLFLETAKGTKISFRSTGDVHVNGWARAFGGGGHRNASGAFVIQSLEKTIEDVMEAAPRFVALSAVEAPDEDVLSTEDASDLASLTDRKENKSGI